MAILGTAHINLHRVDDDMHGVKVFESEISNLQHLRWCKC